MIFFQLQSVVMVVVLVSSGCYNKGSWGKGAFNNGNLLPHSPSHQKSKIKGH